MTLTRNHFLLAFIMGQYIPQYGAILAGVGMPGVGIGKIVTGIVKTAIDGADRTGGRTFAYRGGTIGMSLLEAEFTRR